MSNKIIVKPGDDIAWAGLISGGGVTDFTGYVLKAQVKTVNPATGAYDNLMGEATIAWLDATTGTFTFKVPRSVTVTWPSNRTLALDVRIETPGGEYFRTETAVFYTEQGVTA